MKQLFIILIVLIAIPAVYAEVYIDGFSKQNYNLGEKLQVNGYVLEDGAVQGIFKMDLVCNETVPVFFNLINLEANERYDFSQTIPLRNSMVGDCYISAILEENSVLVSSENSDTITVSDKLNLTVRTNKERYLPNEEVVISGDVNTVNAQIVGKGNIVVSIDGKRYNGEITDGWYSYTLNLPENVKGGEHNIVIDSEDVYGNRGSTDAKINVESVVKSINLEISSLMYKPGDLVKFIPHVYDQAADEIDRNVVFEFVDKDGNVKNVYNINTNEEYGFKLDSIAAPGEWTIRVRDDAVIGKEIITVDAVKQIDTWLENETLYAKNTGNVDYNDEIEIDLKGDKTYQIRKTKLIKPGQTVSIDLSTDVPSGNYDIVVPSNNLITGNVVFGDGKSTSKTAGYVVVGFLFLFLIYMVVKRSGNSERNRRREILEGKRMKKKLTEQVPKPRFGYSEPKVNEKDMKHWIEKATGEKKDNSQKGIFDMFK